MLRSIQAFFSCTCMRCVSRDAARNFLAVFFVDASVDFHGYSPVFGYRVSDVGWLPVMR